MRNVIRAALAVAGFIAPLAAVADFDPCEVSRGDWESVVAPALAGSWTIDNGIGAATVGGMTMPMPPEPPVSAEITHENGRLMISTLGADDTSGPYELKFFDGRPWNLTPSPERAVPPQVAEKLIDDEEVSVAIGCDANTAPRLHVERMFFFSGGSMKMDVYLFVLSDSILYGAGVFEGPGAGGRRVIRVMR